MDRDRDRICEAMVDLCVEHGYANVTVPMVLEHAAVAEAVFEENFGDLEECFCAILEQSRDEMAHRVLVAFAAEEGWQRQMRMAAREMLNFLMEDLRRARFMSVEVVYTGDRAKLIRDEGMRAFFLLIDQGRQEMADPDLLTSFTAEAIGSSIYQRIQSALVNDRLEEFETSVAEMMYLVVLPYLGPEAAEEELTLPPTPLPAR